MSIVSQVQVVGKMSLSLTLNSKEFKSCLSRWRVLMMIALSHLFSWAALELNCVSRQIALGCNKPELDDCAGRPEEG